MAKFFQRVTRGNKKHTPPPVETEGHTKPTDGANAAKAPKEAKDKGNRYANIYSKKSGGGPPLDATKHERGNGTPSNASSKSKDFETRGLHSLYLPMFLQVLKRFG